jgi:hypothetical protein
MVSAILLDRSARRASSALPFPTTLRTARASLVHHIDHHQPFDKQTRLTYDDGKSTSARAARQSRTCRMSSSMQLFSRNRFRLPADRHQGMMDVLPRSGASSCHGVPPRRNQNGHFTKACCGQIMFILAGAPTPPQLESSRNPKAVKGLRDLFSSRIYHKSIRGLRSKYLIQA